MKMKDLYQKNDAISDGHIDIVDDDESLRTTLAELLTFAGFKVRTWPSAEVFLENPPQLAPAVVITDMRMAGISGVEMHEILKAKGRSIPIIYMSGESTIPQTVKAMKLGAIEFLTKPFTREELLQAVVTGLEKDRYQMRDLIERTRLIEASKVLSPREREVLKLLVKGFSNAEIVETLEISLPTAKQYKTQIMHKLGARSISQLIQYEKILTQ